MADKIKAIQPMITVGGKIEKPCYSVTYYDTSDKQWHVGFSSFDFANVKKWLKEEFEVVAETADVVEVKCRCSECKHLKIINKEPVYAECERQKLTFLLWQADTREHTCSYGERRDT